MMAIALWYLVGPELGAMPAETDVEKRACEERRDSAAACMVRTVGPENNFEEAQNWPEYARQFSLISRDLEDPAAVTNLLAMQPAPVCAGSCDECGPEASLL